ncbi:hypothetical protein MLD38_005247 [Melastoma candidum]|uniref:Uncharacterized protein n=1 Tax=Melastoma candidum TaxID=119954 RepID=A0ACB9S921_9MYRT|nr:hypothetical protein MLD38_005247 [Melastoma candidum]
MPLPTLAVLRNPSAGSWMSPASSKPTSSERCGICCPCSYPPTCQVCGSLRPLFRSRGLRSGLRSRQVVRMAPEEEKMTRRSPLDFPIEWERPKPGRRPDIFPQFSPMKTPLPPPLPADPPEEDEEEEEKKEEEEEDPESEEPGEKPEKQ